ncbi:Mss4-like protein [Xylaria scruposa]|nr:Mss4-like protein [Xylaria scruposa]
MLRIIPSIASGGVLSRSFCSSRSYLFSSSTRFALRIPSPIAPSRLSTAESIYPWNLSTRISNRSMSTQQSNKDQTETYVGSCHCGHIKYSASFPLSDSSTFLQKCNCSICRKAGYTLLTPTPTSTFKIISPTEGFAALSDYTFHSKSLHHYFCPRCGVRCFLSVMAGEKAVRDVFVNAGTLDGKADGSKMLELSKLGVKYIDGKSEDWSKPPANKPYDGGLP